MPWDTLEVQGVVWGPLVSLIVSLLKRFGLSNERTLKIVIFVLGGGGIFLKGWLGGESTVDCLISAVIAILSAPGFYELLTKPISRATTLKF